MWSLIVLGYIVTAVHSQQQNTRRPEPHDHGHGWDIRLSVPGEPGGDYPTLNSIPRTSFSCSGKSPGYYADLETGCQVFRVCTLGSTYGFQSFLCPNGTLFNQEVFVCDWWMNVNCRRSQQLFNDNREKFSNLKLGPQLMKDIKKMLTHPMRNSYDKTIVKSNLVVTQEYKPPAGQLFPNGALISRPERPPSNIYVPSKQRQGNYVQTSFISGDLSFAASTPSSQYIPSPFNGFGSAILQQQRQYNQPVQNSNSHVGAIGSKNIEPNNNNRLSYHPANNIQTPLSHNTVPTRQPQRQIIQYNNNINPVDPIKQSDQKKTQPLIYISRQNEKLIQNSNDPQYREVNTPIGNETPYKLASPHNPQQAGKTFKFSRVVQKSSSGNPKSRVTFKTWIVRPSKSAPLVVEPTSYTYNKPTNPPVENRLVITSADNINPTTETLKFKSENAPYVYDKPSPSSKQVIAVEETSVMYLPPTKATFSNRLYSTSTNLEPTQPLLNLPPTTYKPASQFNTTASKSSTVQLSRQYLSPDIELTESNQQSARLKETPTSSLFDYSKQTPSFTITKQSHINTNHNNLSFADILTKEKLDITVNDIVRKTNKILKSAPPDVLNKYREIPEVADNLSKNYLTSEVDNEYYEKSVSQLPRALHKNEKLLDTPSTELEPPLATLNDNYENTNKLLNLPFFQQPVPTNTIERTVSLKISIPETIAEYLFKNHTQSNSDNLEILKTGSSNYLVLTNSINEENNDASLIPIGKLIWNKNLNFSNSQPLVYSFLVDSINTAKAYSNIAKQNVASSALSQSQTKNINHENIEDITNKVSQLTSSHFAKDNRKIANLMLSTASNAQDNPKYDTEPIEKESGLNYQSNYHNHRKNPPDARYSSQLPLNQMNLIETEDRNSKPIYSGQLYKLPVPEVTRKIYNSPNPFHLSQIRQFDLPKDSQADVNNPANNIKNSDVEIISSESVRYAPSAKQQLPSTEASKFNIPADSGDIFSHRIINSDSGITAQVLDKISGTLPHPLEENKLVTYQKNRSYYLFTNLDDENDHNAHISDKVKETNELGNVQNSKLITLTRNKDLSKHVGFEIFPAIGYEIDDELEKQDIIKALKLNNFSDSKYDRRIENLDQRKGDLVTGVDYTILHPTSRKRAEPHNYSNNILYRGPSSYLAPQSSVGSLRESQQSKIIGRIEEFEDNNGYSKIIPVRQFTF